MKFFALSFVCAVFITFLVVHLRDFHFHLSADHDLSGVQKAHAVAVPRIGGVGIFIALLCSAVWLWIIDSPHLRFFLLFLVPSSLVFAVGLLEDLTKRVSVRMRLSVTMLSALIGSYLLNITVRSFGIDAIDTLFQINLIAIIFTMVAVAGVANAVNLVDGFNGLSGFVTVVALLALGVVAYIVGDQLISTIALTSAGAVTGFLFWNYPKAKIFLGDGGAYLVGFIIAELSILLNERNPQVSVLFPLLMMIYPIFETLFTIYRRKFIQGKSPGLPDALHLHQILNKRLVRWSACGKNGSIRSRGNAKTSPYLWVLSSLGTIPAVMFWNNSAVLASFIGLFVVTYVWIYSSLVKFKTPRFLNIPLKKSRMRHSNAASALRGGHHMLRKMSKDFLLKDTD